MATLGGTIGDEGVKKRGGKKRKRERRKGKERKGEKIHRVTIHLPVRVSYPVPCAWRLFAFQLSSFFLSVFFSLVHLFVPILIPSSTIPSSIHLDLSNIQPTDHPKLEGTTLCPLNSLIARLLSTASGEPLTSHWLPGYLVSAE